jgi:hypothetical protein
VNNTVKSLLANKPLQWAIIAAAVLALVYWYGKTSISDTLKYNTPLPNSGSGIPQGWDPNTRAEALYDAMDGILTATATKEGEWQICYQLTEDQLVAVYRTFNKKYCPSPSDGTLTTWIKAETGAWFGSYKDPLVKRLISLNCR